MTIFAQQFNICGLAMRLATVTDGVCGFDPFVAFANP